MHKIVLLFLTVIYCSAQQTAKEYQKELNSFYLDFLASPISLEDKATFSGLEFYEIDEKYIVQAKFILSKKMKNFKMKTTTSRLPIYRKYGELHFTIDGKKCKLNVYQNVEFSKIDKYKDKLFLPFLDETNGKETYSGGRYLDIDIPKDKEIILDFNKSYNPYCAYNKKYSCPIVPKENTLKVSIKAGVKKHNE